MGELNRMTQFKDKSGKAGTNIPVGLYTYPILMAADILLYNTSVVPVGQDQKQHVELTRDLAGRLNNIFEQDLFVLPEPYIGREAARIMDLQNPTRKMSKSAENPMGTIFLSDDEKVILKKFKKAVTDSDTVVTYEPEAKPGIANLIHIQSSITGKTFDEIVSSYEGKMYGHLKIETAAIVAEALRPLQIRTKELLDEKTELEKIIQQGAIRAREKASSTLSRVYDAIGFYP